MTYKPIHCIFAACLALLYASCIDRDAFHSCRKALEESVTSLSQAESMQEVIRIDTELNEILNRYGHSRMTREMIEEIKGKHELYLKTKEDVYKRMNEDSILHRRVINVPDVGEVEFKAPPEV